ncbi:uncharacterized protein LOC128961080 isoform X2 [Oppia nitens]|uniref:uncharacterized protein LOC128961080 isoform X2 n=1 Tax=Oppia nitens TaxID=1686743 RepID=UPI0023D994D8|nr:uncharacterized protein LOC128961080 isoform X2 [Oppia nitens]
MVVLTMTAMPPMNGDVIVDSVAEDITTRNRPLIPAFIGQYRCNDDEKTPQVVVIDVDTKLTKTDRSLCNFYKCTKNWVKQSDSNGNRCFATRHSEINYFTHLNDQHSEEELFCMYCYELMSFSRLKKYNNRYLLKHMIKRHRFRRFQCNLCLYRAITEDHVIIHQKKHHKFLYQKTIDGKLVSSNDTICKIYFCQSITEDTKFPNLKDFYENCKNPIRLNSEGKNETYFQCLYCHFLNEDINKVVEHSVDKHPDYPILYYIPEPQVSLSASSLVMDFINYDSYVPINQPKQEPQDNSISSTIEAEVRINGEKNKRKIDDNNENQTKRLRIETIDKQNESNSSHELIQKNIICLFCDELFKDIESAKKHIEGHMSGQQISHFWCKKVSKWSQHFLLKQEQLCSYEQSDDMDKRSVYYNCPLCVKLAKVNKRIAKRYEQFSDIRNHLWQHSCWLSVKCKLCSIYLPNCDALVVKHLVVNHYSNINKKKFKFLLSFDSESSDILLSDERQILEHKLIETNGHEFVETIIRKMLTDLKESHYKNLLKSTNDKQWNVEIKRLPNNDLNKYLEEYKEYEAKRNQIVSNSKE